MKKLSLVLLAIFCMNFWGCGDADWAPGNATEASNGTVEATETSGAPATASQPEETPSPVPSDPSEAESVAGQDPSQEPAEEAEEASEPAAEQKATLYIGTRAQGFTEYPMTYEGNLTPEMLIQGIADLTGWNLALEEPVISGKGGMSVCLSESSALFEGPPEPQKEEFRMYSAEQLAETLLDSIQKTLQEGFTLEGGDPDALDVWYYLKGENPLALPELGLSWALDQPYQWAQAERE